MTRTGVGNPAKNALSHAREKLKPPIPHRRRRRFKTFNASINSRVGLLHFDTARSLVVKTRQHRWREVVVLPRVVFMQALPAVFRRMRG